MNRGEYFVSDCKIPKVIQGSLLCLLLLNSDGTIITGYILRWGAVKQPILSIY